MSRSDISLSLILALVLTTLSLAILFAQSFERQGSERIIREEVARSSYRAGIESIFQSFLVRPTPVSPLAINAEARIMRARLLKLEVPAEYAAAHLELLLGLSELAGRPEDFRSLERGRERLELVQKIILK